MGKLEDIQTFIATLSELGYDFQELSENALSNAPAGLNLSNGNAFAGGLAMHIVLTYGIAKRIAKMISTSMPIDEESLRKVCFLHQIAKAQMFVTNNTDWEVKKGKVYTFADTPGALKVGERSALIASNAGIKFTYEEYEAMRILDKSGEDYEAQKFIISPLSLVLRQANDMAYAIEKARYDSEN